MTLNRCIQAAWLRGIWIDGNGKQWINNMVGYGYVGDDGNGYFLCDTLQGLYSWIMSHKRI